MECPLNKFRSRGLPRGSLFLSLLGFRALSISSTSFLICFLPRVLFLSISLTITLSVLFSSPCTPCAAVSRACVYACCVISPLVSLRQCSFFFSSVCNVPNVTLLRLCPGQSLHTSTSGSPHPVKKVQKNFKNNYASVECGAKILSANNEAKVRHTSHLSLAAYKQTHAQLRIQMSCYISRLMKPASKSLLYFNEH